MTYAVICKLFLVDFHKYLALAADLENSCLQMGKWAKFIMTEVLGLVGGNFLGRKVL